MPRQRALARMAEDLSCEEMTTGAIMLRVWVAQKAKVKWVSPASFHYLKVAALDQKQWMVPLLNHTSTNLWVAIWVVALTLQVDPQTIVIEIHRKVSVMHAQGVLKCLSHTPGYHSICIIRTVLRVNPKIAKWFFQSKFYLKHRNPLHCNMRQEF